MAPVSIRDDGVTVRVHGPADAPTLVYLPGLHGDWTLVAGFRARVVPRVRFVDMSYPRTATWSLDDYTCAIERALDEHGIGSGWLLAESWGSQPAWQLADRARRGDGRMRVDGLILAGGFVQHPWPWTVTRARHRLSSISAERLQRGFGAYRLYARFRLRHAPETFAELDEFLARRTESDLRAAVHRLDLMEANDLRPLARAFRGPLYYLTGGIDPIVPWPFILRWLERNCPGYRGCRVLWRADHNVLNGLGSAEQVLAWMDAPARG
jgi:pimeloyl-ACP methyl ester carboxylesterase